MREDAKTTVAVHSRAELGRQVDAFPIADKWSDSEPMGTTSWIGELIIYGFLLAGGVAIYFMQQANPCPSIYRMIL